MPVLLSTDPKPRQHSHLRLVQIARSLSWLSASHLHALSGFELLGGLVGAAFYVVEVLGHLGNMPGYRVVFSAYGMLTGSIDWFAIEMALIHLVLAFFLLAVAMTRWSHQTPPLRLYAWGIGISLVLYLGNPNWLMVPWRLLPNGAFEAPSRPDVLLTWVFGLTAGGVVGQGTWMLFRKRLLSLGNSATEYANYLAWLLSFVLIGAYLGWQAMPSIAVLLTLLLACMSVPRFLIGWKGGALPDPMAWIWFSYIVHLFTWHWQGLLR